MLSIFPRSYLRRPIPVHLPADTVRVTSMAVRLIEGKGVPNIGSRGRTTRRFRDGTVEKDRRVPCSQTLEDMESPAVRFIGFTWTAR